MRSSLLKAATIAVASLVCSTASAAIDFTVSSTPAYPWAGFMNVSDLPANGGAYQFGSPWGPADLTATFAGEVLTLGPNTIGDPDPYWYTPAGGPGAAGNKIMDANMYVESPNPVATNVGEWSGQMLTFSGLVLSNTLTSAHTSVAFIRDFASDFSSLNQVTVPLTPGAFSISLNTDPGPGRHVQYGFQTVGVNVWVTDVAPYGNAQVTAVPEPTSLGFLAAGALIALRRRRV